MFFRKCHIRYISIFGGHGGNTPGGFNSPTCHFNIYDLVEEPGISNRNFLEPGISVQINTVMLHRLDFYHRNGQLFGPLHINFMSKFSMSPNCAIAAQGL